MIIPELTPSQKRSVALKVCLELLKAELRSTQREMRKFSHVPESDYDDKQRRIVERYQDAAVAYSYIEQKKAQRVMEF